VCLCLLACCSLNTDSKSETNGAVLDAQEWALLAQACEIRGKRVSVPYLRDVSAASKISTFFTRQRFPSLSQQDCDRLNALQPVNMFEVACALVTIPSKLDVSMQIPALSQEQTNILREHSVDMHTLYDVCKLLHVTSIWDLSDKTQAADVDLRPLLSKLMQSHLTTITVKDDNADDSAGRKDDSPIPVADSSPRRFDWLVKCVLEIYFFSLLSSKNTEKMTNSNAPVSSPSPLPARPSTQSRTSTRSVADSASTMDEENIVAGVNEPSERPSEFLNHDFLEVEDNNLSSQLYDSKLESDCPIPPPSSPVAGLNRTNSISSMTSTNTNTPGSLTAYSYKHNVKRQSWQEAAGRTKGGTGENI
jgi:hypothetical protein